MTNLRESDLFNHDFFWLINEITEQNLLYQVGYSEWFIGKPFKAILWEQTIWEDKVNRVLLSQPMIPKDIIGSGDTLFEALNDAYLNYLRLFTYWSCYYENKEESSDFIV